MPGKIFLFKLHHTPSPNLYTCIASYVSSDRFIILLLHMNETDTASIGGCTDYKGRRYIVCAKFEPQQTS